MAKLAGSEQIPKSKGHAIRALTLQSPGSFFMPDTPERISGVVGRQGLMGRHREMGETTSISHVPIFARMDCALYLALY